ncbi:MAG TPA: DNA-directed RNA polymerase subunit alpha [Candidatus Brocadiia bacterium]|nr:DNA-directed RNA polymerase subunit alpha [Planctomycetota bacterium]MBI4008213.1 DNA-directed RNA polymerase subunit alpha [Planctomycetota bacterium]MDO8092437.1 DNA-directed RNA polymerase subunit alpha [Candidatus Brocadiales bacterium]
MRIRWRGFELPSRITVERETLTNIYGKFIAEPFERGYGVTIGNGLRRVLLSSLEGSAVVSVKIDKIKHEFSTIPGVVEDVTDVILNIKNLVVKSHADKETTIKIEAHKKGEIKAKDIITDGNIEILNGDLHIATLSEETDFKVEMNVRKGRGYITAEENESEEQEIGRIPIDSIFSPVRKVSLKTEDARVGRRTNYDRLIMEIWTNGIVTPEMALVEAAKILRKHLNPFVQYFEIGRELPKAEIKPAIEPVKAKVLAKEPDPKIDLPVSELDLSVRASNCLDAANIKTIGDLISLTEEELLEIRNFGKTTLKEVKKKLAQRSLSFATTSKVG